MIFTLAHIRVPNRATTLACPSRIPAQALIPKTLSHIFEPFFHYEAIHTLTRILLLADFNSLFAFGSDG
jgi:hypothetical protein